MIFGTDRNQLRRFYCETWQRRQRGEVLDPLGQQVALVIEEHPEYHALVASADQALSTEFTPEAGQVNPFLHMGMHLAIREQVSTDRPAGIHQVYQQLLQRLGAHEAEHAMMDCLGEAIWTAQRTQAAPDEQGYLDRHVDDAGGERCDREPLEEWPDLREDDAEDVVHALAVRRARLLDEPPGRARP